MSTPSPNAASSHAEVPPNTDAANDIPLSTDIVNAVEQKLPVAILSDWLMLLQGPSETLFPEKYNFENEWKRLFRLVGLVLLMLGAIVAIFSIGLNASGQSWRDFASNSKYLLLILVSGAVVAVPYAFVLAPLLRIRVTFVQTFFAVLLLGLPWLPLITFVWAIGRVWSGGLVIAIFLYLMTLVPMVHFCRGISRLANCHIWRPIVSLLIPLVLGLTVFAANVIWE
jgi:hypothetical protein